VVAAVNAVRYRCCGCELVTRLGPLTLHQRATGHDGMEPVE
jgi:hypothetical protein